VQGVAGRGPEALAEQRWRAAEERLYPLVMTDPGAYQRTLAAVQSVVAALREDAASVADLMAAEADPDALLAAVADRPPLPAELLVQAACGVRSREIAAAREGERRAAAVDAARAGGLAWAVLEGPERVEELFSGSSVLVHLATGRTLVAVADPYSGAEPYRLQEFGPGGEPGRERAFAEPAAWAAERARWRAEIDTA
jgi:lambda repressor-like predicted transcriptional regulator